MFADGTRVWTDDELLAAFQLEPYSTPGAEWHYSNTGYTLLGQILGPLLGGAWKKRHNLRLVDALYVELASHLDARIATTDAGLAAASNSADYLA